MLYKTRGIALSYIKYKETSIITKIFTELFGLQTYIQNGVRSEKAKTKMALFQPLTLLDLVVYHKPNQDINRINEIKCAFNYSTVQSDYIKICISSFVSEILSKTLKEYDKNENLFEFLYKTFQSFDNASHQALANFPIEFLIHYYEYLGIMTSSKDDYISQIISMKPAYVKIIQEEEMDHYLDRFFENEPLPLLSKANHALVLDSLIDYLQLNMQNVGEIKSIKVLRSL